MWMDGGKGGPEFFYFVRGGTRIFFSFVRLDKFFYRGQRGGPAKIGNSSSQIDGPPILIKTIPPLEDLPTGLTLPFKD